MKAKNSAAARKHRPDSGAAPHRRRDRGALPRCLLYRHFSLMTSSPFDGPIAAAGGLPSKDLGQSIEKQATNLPYRLEVSPLTDMIAALTEKDAPRLKQTYGSLFEVGACGPPIALRAELGREHGAKAKEEIVRFYDYFSYPLAENIAWSPDHLSVLLEFMHLLSFREAVAEDDTFTLSNQLAQSDFAERHILDWLPGTLKKVETMADDYYRTLFRTLDAFLAADHLWLRSSIGDRDPEARE